jgi:hypothetical protein
VWVRATVLAFVLQKLYCYMRFLVKSFTRTAIGFKQEEINMGEKIARFLSGAGSILTFGSGVTLGKSPDFYDKEALAGRGVARDFSAVAQDLVVANRKMTQIERRERSAQKEPRQKTGS